MKTFVTLLLFCSVNVLLAANPAVDSANTDYLKGQARLKRENMQTLVKKSEELIALYNGYKERASVCQGAKPQWKKALKLANRAHKQSQEALKLADKAEKAKTMSVAKKCLRDIDRLQLSAREDCLISEERKKEIDFELKGCQ